MSLTTIGIIGVAVCFLLIFLRMPIYMAFMATGFLGVWVVRGLNPAFNTIGQVPYQTASMYVWTVVPLFMFMGYIALHSRLALEFFEGIRKWIGHIRGGLGMTVIIGNTGFGACTGDPVGAAVTFTAMCLPEMRRYGYKDTLTLGAVAAGGILAALIPPSLGFILYGALTETSIGELFIAGIFPGLILTTLYVIIIAIWVWRDPQVGPRGPVSSWRDRWTGTIGMWALVVVFATILGGIYTGLFTPTEAGAAGAFIVLVIALARRRLTWQSWKDTLLETGASVGMVGALLVGTMVFNVFLVVTRLPAAIAVFLGSISTSPYVVMWAIIVALWILGCLIDSLALTLIMVPILFPVAMQLGFDPIHFGVIFTVAMLSGTLTPPFGIVVYAVAGTAKDVPLFRVFRGAAPFLFAVIALQALVLYVPELAVWLPGKMLGT